VTALAPDELAALQSRLLEAVLASAPLEAGGSPVRFPDLAFVQGHPVVYVLEENLGGSLRVDTPQTVRVVSGEELVAAARDHGDVAYFRFQPAEVGDQAVRLTLEAKIASAEAQPGLGLSAIQVTFEKTDGQWRAVSPPTLSAA
jgi:hypothetical protein